MTLHLCDSLAHSKGEVSRWLSENLGQGAGSLHQSEQRNVECTQINPVRPQTPISVIPTALNLVLGIQWAWSKFSELYRVNIKYKIQMFLSLVNGDLSNGRDIFAWGIWVSIALILQLVPHFGLFIYLLTYFKAEFIEEKCLKVQWWGSSKPWSRSASLGKKCQGRTARLVFGEEWLAAAPGLLTAWVGSNGMHRTCFHQQCPLEAPSQSLRRSSL